MLGGWSWAGVSGSGRKEGRGGAERWWVARRCWRARSLSSTTPTDADPLPPHRPLLTLVRTRLGASSQPQFDPVAQQGRAAWGECAHRRHNQRWRDVRSLGALMLAQRPACSHSELDGSGGWRTQGRKGRASRQVPRQMAGAGRCTCHDRVGQGRGTGLAIWHSSAHTRRAAAGQQAQAHAGRRVWHWFRVREVVLNNTSLVVCGMARRPLSHDPLRRR